MIQGPSGEAAYSSTGHEIRVSYGTKVKVKLYLCFN
jgi:hypothetical protein